MAKGKPNLAFLEALKQDKRRRGDQSPGGAFKTPEWFKKNPPAAPAQEAKGPAAAGQPATAHKGFRVTPTHIAIAAAAVVIVATAAFMAGRKPAMPQTSASTDTMRSAPAQGNVMDVPANRVAVTPPPLVPAPAQTQTAPAAGTAQQPPAANIAAPAGARTIGMTYVVFQSYKDEKLASEARDALMAGGIGATVEKGLDYAPTWYVVVGTQGFAKPSSAEYTKYMSKVRLISEKFAGKSKWRLFEPNPYTWKGR